MTEGKSNSHTSSEKVEFFGGVEGTKFYRRVK